MRTFRFPGLAAAALLLALGTASAGDDDAARGADTWQDAREALELKTVGTTRLRWLMFRVYDAALWTPTGRFDGLESGEVKALEIEYLRSISAERILDITRDEWVRLGIGDDESRERWLEQLADIIPDVRDGSRLTAVAFPDGYTRFFDGDGLIGEVDEPDFGRHFLAIWLHEDTREASMRRELIGES